MKNKAVIVVIGSLILGFVPLNGLMAQTGFVPVRDMISFEKKLSATATETQTLQSDFVQENEISLLTEKIISRGTFAFRQPGQVLWVYTQPDNYSVVMNAAGVKIKQNGKVQSYNLGGNKAFKEIHTLMSQSLRGKLVQNDARYQYRYFESNTQYLVELTLLDNSSKGYFERMQLFLDRTRFAVTEIVLHDSAGDKVRIRFTNTKVNAPLSDTVFDLR